MLFATDEVYGPFVNRELVGEVLAVPWQGGDRYSARVRVTPNATLSSFAELRRPPAGQLMGYRLASLQFRLR